MSKIKNYHAVNDGLFARVPSANLRQGNVQGHKIRHLAGKKRQGTS